MATTLQVKGTDITNDKAAQKLANKLAWQKWRQEQRRRFGNVENWRQLLRQSVSTAKNE